MRRRVLPSGSLTVAVRVPPPTSVGAEARVDPAAQTSEIAASEVGSRDVSDRNGHSVVGSVGHEYDLEPCHVVPNVERRLSIRAYAEECRLYGFRHLEIVDVVTIELSVFIPL